MLEKLSLTGIFETGFCCLGGISTVPVLMSEPPPDLYARGKFGLKVKMVESDISDELAGAFQHCGIEAESVLFELVCYAVIETDRFLER